MRNFVSVCVFSCLKYSVAQKIRDRIFVKRPFHKPRPVPNVWSSSLCKDICTCRCLCFLNIRFVFSLLYTLHHAKQLPSLPRDSIFLVTAWHSATLAYFYILVLTVLPFPYHVILFSSTKLWILLNSFRPSLYLLVRDTVWPDKAACFLPIVCLRYGDLVSKYNVIVVRKRFITKKD